MNDKTERVDYNKLFGKGNELNEISAMLLQKISGLSRFPMRKIERKLQIKDYQHESMVDFNFRNGGCNLFSYSICPEEYLNAGKKEYYDDYIAYKFLILSHDIFEDELADLWSKQIVRKCLELGVFRRFKSGNKHKLISMVRMVPFHETLIVVDKYDRTYNDMVYLSYDSLVFSELIVNHGINGQNICDLFCGSGILGIVSVKENCTDHSAINNHIVHGNDINQRALDCSTVNASISNIQFQCHNQTYSDISNVIEKADLILFNPPFIFGPASRGLVDSDGGVMGIEHTVNVMHILSERMHNNSRFAAIAQTPIVKNKDILLERLSKIENLEMDYMILDEFKPYTKFVDWYDSHEVNGFRQVFLSGRKSCNPSIKLKNTIGDYCFA